MHKKKIPICMKLCYIVILTLVTISFSMARYKTTVNGNIDAKSAVWTFKANNCTTESFFINLPDTAEESIYYKKENNVIAPGAKGSFKIIIDCTGCQVALNYKIKLTTNANSEMPREIIFYDKNDSNRPLINSTNSSEEERLLTGTISLDEIKSQTDYKKEITIDWMWQVNVDRNENNFQGNNFYIDAVVTGEQQID